MYIERVLILIRKKPYAAMQQYKKTFYLNMKKYQCNNELMDKYRFI